MGKINKVTKKIKDSLEKTQTIQMVKRMTKSRVTQNSHLYTEDNNPDVKPLKDNLNLTKQQKFNFESNAFEDDEKDKKNNKNRIKESKNEIKRELIKVEKQKNRYKRFFLLFLILFLVVLIGLFISIYYHMEYEPQVVTKEIKKEIVSENILFLGDSITHRYDLDKYFSKYNVVNSGIDGNTTDDILSDMKNRVYQYNPSKVFLLIGTNDLMEEKSEDYIVDNIKKIVNQIKDNRKLSDIYIESIYPVDENGTNADGRKNKDIISLNKKIKEYCNENKIEYIDMFDILKDDSDSMKEEYTIDGLHLSDEGYKVISEELEKYI